MIELSIDPRHSKIRVMRVLTGCARLNTYSDGKKYEDICPSTHNMECPIVKRTEYQLIDVDDEGFCTLMDDNGDTRDDLKPIDPELEKQIREKVDSGEDALVCVLKVRPLLFSDILIQPCLRPLGRFAIKLALTYHYF